MDWMRLTISLLIVFIAAAIGNLATTPNIDSWYSQLNKTVINPPNWVFAPVWTILYILIGLALYFVWTDPGTKKRLAYTIFAVQLVLNVAWSVVFFGFQQPWAGVGVIIALLTSILATIAIFWSHSKLSAVLLIPYALWVTFAMALNIGVAALN